MYNCEYSFLPNKYLLSIYSHGCDVTTSTNEHFITFFYMCVDVSVWILRCYGTLYGGQRKISGSQFSSSTMLVLGTKHRSSGVAASVCHKANLQLI